MVASVDKFSLALKRGFNELNEVSQVKGDPDGELTAVVSYFSIERDGHGGVNVAKTFGWRVLDEHEIDLYRDADKRTPIDPGFMEMLNRVEDTFRRVREEGLDLDDLNETLKDNTEGFYQKYIAGERITQVYNPISRNFVSEDPDKPEDKFMFRRWLQKLDARIGKQNEIPHERIRETWGLDNE